MQNVHRTNRKYQFSYWFVEWGIKISSFRSNDCFDYRNTLRLRRNWLCPVFCALLFHLQIDLLLIDESFLLSFLMRMDHIERHSQFSWHNAFMPTCYVLAYGFVCVLMGCGCTLDPFVIYIHTLNAVPGCQVQTLCVRWAMQMVYSECVDVKGVCVSVFAITHRV